MLATAAHALPRALDRVDRPAGTAVRFAAAGDGGGTWYVVRSGAGWELAVQQSERQVACRARTTLDGAAEALHP